MRFILGFCLMSLALCGCGGSGASSGSAATSDPSAAPSDPGPAPTIGSLAPSSATAGGGSFTLTVSGGNFNSASAVAWNGVMLTTTFVSATQLTAQVPAADLSAGGTAQVTVVNAAANGGTSAAAAFTIATAQNGVPALVQSKPYQTTNTNGENNSSVTFDSMTKAGDTIWVAVTVPTAGGVHTITVTDSQGNPYTQLDQKNDLLQGATQSVAHFYAANIVGDSSTPDTVTVNWTFDDYKGVLIAEISGTTAAPFVNESSNLQDTLAAGTGNVTSGAINVSSAQTPGLLVALSMNTSGGSSDTGGSGATGPAAGTGMTQQLMLWDWGANLGTFATAPVTTAGSVSAVFNALHLDSYVTVAAVFH